MITYFLPYPPSLNSYYRTVHGQPIISKAGREYRKSIILEIGNTGKSLPGRLKVEIHAWMPDKRKRDLDNVFKALNDALTHANVWIDDSQIDDLRIIRFFDSYGGRVEVFISEIS
jgi:crossover junction endodeoxyribonuclease RusA